MFVNKTIRILTALFFLVGWSGCKTHSEIEITSVTRIDDNTLKLSNAVLENIKMATATVEDYPETLSLMGKISVTEDRTMVVPARIQGRTDAVYVSSGEQVSKGQILASIFSSDFLVAREEYLQALAEAEAPQASEDSKNMLILAKKKLDSLGMSQADIAALRTKTKEMGTSLFVRAPRDGAILDKKAVIGTLVNVGDTLFTLGDLSKVWFAGDVYPEDLPKIRQNQEVLIESPMDDKKIIHGKVSFISPVMDPNTRTIKIRALMDNLDKALRGDMYVKGSLILRTRKALQIPRNALLQLRDTTFCFKRLDKNQFRRIPIEVESEQAGRIAVTKGLDEGDSVVAEGALLLEGALSSEN